MPRLATYLMLSFCPFLVGCGSSDDAFTIVVIPKGLTHEHWQSVRRGAERCATDLAEEGVTVRIIFDGPLRERDAMEQIRIVDRRIATGLPGRTGLVLAPQHSQTMTACVKRADESGVPVVLIDSGLSDTTHMAKYVATNNYNGGCLAARHLLDVLKRQGKTRPRLILFRYAIGSESTEQREKGFEDTVNQLCPDVVWLSIDKYAGATKDSAAREAGPMILQFQDQVDAIFAPNESSASGTVEVLRSQGLNGKILVMGFDASKPLLDAIEKGDVVGSILQDPYKMGYLSTWFCVRRLRGDDINNSRKELDLGTGEFLVVKENLNTDFVRGLYDPAFQARRTTRELRTPPTGQGGKP